MKRLLSGHDVAELLGISRAAAYREMKKMDHVVIGLRSLRVTEAALENYLRKRLEVPCERRSVSTGRRETPSGTDGSTTRRVGESASAPRSPTSEPPSKFSSSVSARPILRVVQPRTRPL